MKSQRQGGIALVVSLILLVAALLLGLSSLQSSRLDEAMAGNQRAMVQARLAAEQGAARFGQWLDSLAGNWPSNATEADGWQTETGLIPGAVNAARPPAYYQVVPVGADGVEWVPDKSDPVSVRVRLRGFVDAAGNASAPVVATGLVVGFRKPPAIPAQSAFTCFFAGTCEIQIKGNATLTGKNYGLPSVFDCRGSGCDAAAQGNGDMADTYVPAEDATSLAERNYWKSLIDGWVANDVFGCHRAYSGVQVDTDVGGRGGACLIDVVSGIVQVTGNTNTAGVFIVRAGATLDFRGTGHHEGLIIVEEGGNLAFSAGSPYVYGAIIDLKGNSSQDIVIEDLSVSGNLVIRYSAAALEALSQQVGLTLPSWQEAVIDS